MPNSTLPYSTSITQEICIIREVFYFVKLYKIAFSVYIMWLKIDIRKLTKIVEIQKIMIDYNPI